MALTTACKSCSLHPLCLPLALSTEDIDSLDAIIKRGKPIKKGEYLFHQGDECTSVYAVRTGTLKSFALSSDGEEQVTGFYLPSELIGLESYDALTYPASAKALETTNVCEIPIDKLDELSGQLPQLRRQLMRLMSKELREEQNMMLLLSKKSSEERIASFLINLSARYKRRGFCPTTFRLSMSRADIANYLGLAVETVSRIFSRFQKQGFLSETGNAKDIVINNMNGLTNIASLAQCERVELGLFE